MVLLKDIAFWAVVVVLQLASGYQVAKISFEVEKNWKNKNYGSETTESPFLRILFFPVAVKEKIDELETNTRHFFPNIPGRVYIFLHMLFWEIRIALNIISILIDFVIIPPIALIIIIAIRMTNSVFVLFKTALSA